MHPDAGEARLVIDSIARDKIPAKALTDLDSMGTSYFVMEESDRLIRWHYEGEQRETLVIDGIEYDE